MARPDKVADVGRIADKLRDSNAAVLTEYRGLTVQQLKELRRALGGNATYAVVKNTLTKRAAHEVGIAGLDADLTGPTAIAFITGEPVEAAKALRDFAKANPALVIKSGVLEGKPLTTAEITKLADLDSREVLLAKAAGAMKGKLNQAAYLFVALPSQAARVFDALRLKQEEAGPAADADNAVAETPAETEADAGAAVVTEATAETEASAPTPAAAVVPETTEAAAAAAVAE